MLLAGVLSMRAFDWMEMFTRSSKWSISFMVVCSVVMGGYSWLAAEEFQGATGGSPERWRAGGRGVGVAGHFFIPALPKIDGRARARARARAVLICSGDGAERVGVVEDFAHLSQERVG